MSPLNETTVIEKYDIETPVLAHQDSTTKEEQAYDDSYFSDYGYYWKLLADTLFMTGSALYLVMAVESLEWYKYEDALPVEVRQADDDWTWYTYYNETGAEYWEDDYLFQVNGNDGSWVNRAMVLYFSAALCFLLTGLLDLWRTRDLFNIIMILAACFGVASSMLVIKNQRLAIIFNSVSVHLFATEALYMLFTRRPKVLRAWLYISDVFFLCGTLIDCVLSYYHVFDKFSLRHGKAAVAAACFWLVCSLIYVGVTMYLLVQKNKRTAKAAAAEEITTSKPNVQLTPDGSEESLESD